MFRRIFICTILFICSHVAYGHIFSYISSTTTYPNNRDKIEYDFTISAWTNGQAANPCYGVNHCMISINHRHEKGGFGSFGGVVKSWDLYCLNEGASIDDLRDCLVKNGGLQLPFHGTAVHTGGPTTVKECVGIFYSKDGDKYHILPGSTCGIAPPINGSCTVPASVTLDHGNISMSQVPNNSASTQMIIDCNIGTSINMYISGLGEDSGLSLGDGVYSNLVINKKSVTDKGIPLNLSSGQNIIPIESNLSVKGSITKGPHQGQAVIFFALE